MPALRWRTITIEARDALALRAKEADMTTPAEEWSAPQMFEHPGNESLADGPAHVARTAFRTLKDASVVLLMRHSLHNVTLTGSGLGS